MAGYASARLVTYGTHSERRRARVWIALVRDKRLGSAARPSLRPRGPGSRHGERRRARSSLADVSSGHSTAFLGSKTKIKKILACTGLMYY